MDMAVLQDWVGRSSQADDVLALPQARLLAATLGTPQDALVDGARLPPLWHWIYFLEGLPATQLGPDGHPARGGFLPPVPLPNRMWAGGSLHFALPLQIGLAAQRHSRIVSVQGKQGRSGALVFVTVEHRIYQQGQLAVCELHDIVYKENAPPRPPARAAATMPIASIAAGPSPSPIAIAGSDQNTGPAAAPSVLPPTLQLPPSVQHAELRPDSTQLFRYSALTFNGHRIHYDQDYCRQVEGYDNLVIHGPLIATLLAGWAEQCEGKPLKRFVYRGLQAAILGQNLALHAGASVETGCREVWMTLASGAPSMRAQAYF